MSLFWEVPLMSEQALSALRAWIRQELQRCAWEMDPPYVWSAGLRAKARADHAHFLALLDCLDALEAKQVSLLPA
jgi:hypothetical protein